MNRLTQEEIDFLANVVDDYIELSMGSNLYSKGKLLHIFSKIMNGNEEAQV
jgi:hypothetical protein